ncbi:MAG: 3-dehydroquinate synthase, partial [Nonlabens sp.]
LITDKDYYEQVAKTGLAQNNWLAIIAHSVEIKTQVVKQDPREGGLRKVLNFGHTIGHAIESYYLDSENHLLHGEAIAIGMICEAYVSKKLLSLQETHLKEICNTILNIYPELNVYKKDFTAIIKLMYQDKKNVGNFLNHSLLYEIGRAGYDVAVDEKDVMDALFFYLTLKQ